MSPLTGESQPVPRAAGDTGATASMLDATDLVFAGTLCTQGEAEAVVFDTGMATQLGRIATLSARVKTEASPLQQQVNRAALLIAAIAVASAVVFFVAGITLARAATRVRRDRRRRPARGQRARRTAADDHAVAGRRGAAHGPQTGAGQATDRGRDARVDRRDLHRQDRHPDGRTHGCPAPVGRRRRADDGRRRRARSAAPSRSTRSPGRRSAATTRH